VVRKANDRRFVREAIAFRLKLTVSPSGCQRCRSIETTQRYIDGDTDSQRKLVSLI
jgi:hypothetical protein